MTARGNEETGIFPHLEITREVAGVNGIARWQSKQEQDL